MKKLIFSSFLFLSAGLQGYINSNPEDIGFFGEWIYFQPKFDNSYFVVDNNQLVPGEGTVGEETTRRKNFPQYQSGFRVGAYYGFNCGRTDLILRYTQLTEDYSRHLFSPGVNGTGEAFFAAVGDSYVLSLIPGGTPPAAIPFATANANASFKYYSGEALISQQLIELSDVAINFHMGAHFASLSNHNHYDFATVAGVHYLVEEKTWYWGVGPQFGLDLNYDLGCDFSIVGRAAGILLIGRNQSFTESTAPSAPYSIKLTNDNDWRFVPAQNYRLGLNYFLNPRCWCVGFNIEAGYEFMAYFRAFDTIVNRSNPQNPHNLQSFDTFANVGMNGPYVNLVISF